MSYSEEFHDIEIFPVVLGWNGEPLTYTAPVRKDRMGRVVTWPEGTMRPLALHEPPWNPWTRLVPARPCPEPDQSGTACGAFLSIRYETDTYLCAAGHHVTAERMYRLTGRYR